MAQQNEPGGEMGAGEPAAGPQHPENERDDAGPSGADGNPFRDDDIASGHLGEPGGPDWADEPD